MGQLLQRLYLYDLQMRLMLYGVFELVFFQCDFGIIKKFVGRELKVDLKFYRNGNRNEREEGKEGVEIKGKDIKEI